MDLLALSLGKAVRDASTAIVYAARCSDITTLQPIGYRLARLDRSRARVERHPARGAAVEDPGQPRREEWRDIAVALERRDRAKPFSSGGRSSAAARPFATARGEELAFATTPSHRAIRTINVRGLPSRPQPLLRAGTGEEVDNGIEIGGPPEEATRGFRWPGNWARGGSA